MAAVVVSADGGVAPLDSDSASPRIPSPAPEQTLQNNALLGLPIVAIENILNFLTYDEISLLRLVRKQRVSARKPRRVVFSYNCVLEQHSRLQSSSTRAAH